MMRRFYIQVLILAFQVADLHYTCGTAVGKRCSQAPTVENCSIILRQWSFSSSENRCENDFVCSQHPNAFQTESDCNTACPPDPIKKPTRKPKTRDCLYWVRHPYLCRKSTITKHVDKKGVLHTVMWFTKCKGAGLSVYAYDLFERTCTESPRIPTVNGE